MRFRQKATQKSTICGFCIIKISLKNKRRLSAKPYAAVRDARLENCINRIRQIAKTRSGKTAKRNAASKIKMCINDKVFAFPSLLKRDYVI